MSSLYQAESGDRNPVEVAGSPTKAYNLLWIAPTFPGSDEEFRQPITDQTIENMYGIAGRNPNVNVQLWIDSKRMTNSQRGWLERKVGESITPNLSLLDLRSISDYDSNPLYNQPDNPSEASHKQSLIWRQVDAARLLACLQGNHAQVFYSDTDIDNLNVESAEIQGRLSKHGVIFGGGILDSSGYHWFENSLFGFDSSRRDFLRLLHDETVADVVENERNGYLIYCDLIKRELVDKEKVDPKEVIFRQAYAWLSPRHETH